MDVKYHLLWFCNLSHGSHHHFMLLRHFIGLMLFPPALELKLITHKRSGKDFPPLTFFLFSRLLEEKNDGRDIVLTEGVL